MLLGIRRRLAGIPFERDFFHAEISNTTYCSPQRGIFSANDKSPAVRRTARMDCKQ
jgi:hypothetical protein